MPDWKEYLRNQLGGLKLNPTREAEILDELSLHLEDRYQELIAAGSSPNEAEQTARAELTDGNLLSDELRRVERQTFAEPAVLGTNKRVHLLADLWHDLRHSFRLLRKNPGFTFIAVLTLALGIGANTAIFSLINALMFRNLPVTNPQELVLFRTAGPTVPQRSGYNFNYPLYQMIRDQNQSFTGVFAANTAFRGRFVVKDSTGNGVAESVQQQRVSGNFFSVLGVQAIKGRTLTETDDNPANTEAGAVISYEFWQRRFNLDSDIVGKKVTVNNAPLTIVGVMPPGFFGFEVGVRPELWWPIKIMKDPNLGRSQSWWIRVMARLRPGVSTAQAQAEVDTIFRRQVDEEGSQMTWTSTEQRRNHYERHAVLESGGIGHTGLRHQFRKPLFILMSTVGLVLLIACVNVANLLLARSAARRKEIGVRLALGASRFRLIRQLLTESVLLSVLGGLLSVIFARACLSVLINYLPTQSQTALDLSPDIRVFGFMLLVSVVTGLLFGLAPAWQASHLSLTGSLKDQTGASSGPSRLVLNKLLVVTQVALSLFLLIGAGLFVRSLRNLRHLDVGLNYDNIVQFSLDTGTGYNQQQLDDLYKRMLLRLEALPGVHSATVLYFSLLSGGGLTFNIVATGVPHGPEENTECNAMAVGPRFFETMKMPILAGRDFEQKDERPVATPTPPGNLKSQGMAGAAPFAAVINQTMARFFFGNEDPVGKYFSYKGSGQRFEVIGVTQDSKYSNLREETPRTYYTYYFQQPGRSMITFQVRTTAENADYGGLIQKMVREVDPQVQVVGLQTMADVVDQSLVQERFIAQTASAFSLIALLLACVGLYGVMSYAVTRRTNEIGIRMALGAQGQDVVQMVMREVVLLVAIGISIGLVAALVSMRLVSDLLFALKPTDPLTIVLATTLLAVVAIMAGYLPARRASRVDPLVALRWE